MSFDGLPGKESLKPAWWAGRRVLVVGLGRFGGGVGVTRWLVAQGARVTVTDVADATSLEASIEAIAGLDVGLVLGGHDACDLDAVDLAVINPAVVKGRSTLFAAIGRAGNGTFFAKSVPHPPIIESRVIDEG